MNAPLRHDKLFDVGQKSPQVICIEHLMIGLVLVAGFVAGGIALATWLAAG